MPKIKLRYQRVSDAKRFYEILNNPNFIYISLKLKSIQEEKEWLAKGKERRKNNLSYDFAIVYQNKVIGAVGVRVNPHLKGNGDIGYFIDEAYWGKGIATEAVKLIEKFAYKVLKLYRLELRIKPKNKASIKVAIKNGYRKEGLLRGRKGKNEDCYLFAKVKD
ncbi:MAG TPA: GNAT family N-acetyltransferase [Patescibacteria group bacterium]|nr:GNAT family N-acetyltransferase [Patescibacteria group bacterium]